MPWLTVFSVLARGAWHVGALNTVVGTSVKWSISLENTFCKKTPLHNIAMAIVIVIRIVAFIFIR